MRTLTAAIGMLAVAVSASGQVPDHLACYKVRDTAARATYTATVGGLTVQAGCTIKVPAAMACVPASKTAVVPTPPGGGGIGRPNGFTCYKVKCPTAHFAPVTVQDQFGMRALTPRTTSLVCAPDTGPTDGGFPASGQTTCWDSSGNLIPCAGTGHDGDTHTGAPLAYVDNGDGTITDAKTGLMWEKQSKGDGSVHDTDNLYTWDSAFSAHVGTLNTTSFAGHADWRVPNVRELASIVNYENFNPAVSPAFHNNCTPPCTVLTCSCTVANNDWTSTSVAHDPQRAWVVYFADGGVNQNFTTNAYSVRAVRGGS
jgi:hypothetical protein